MAISDSDATPFFKELLCFTDAHAQQPSVWREARGILNALRKCESDISMEAATSLTVIGRAACLRCTRPPCSIAMASDHLSDSLWAPPGARQRGGPPSVTTDTDRIVADWREHSNRLGNVLFMSFIQPLVNSRPRSVGLKEGWLSCFPP